MHNIDFIKLRNVAIFFKTKSSTVFGYFLCFSCFLSCIKYLNVNRVLKIVTGLRSSADKSLASTKVILCCQIKVVQMV